MRVYIAIDFHGDVKNYLENLTTSIKNHCTEGSFTRKENFHMTIRFIGEANKLQIDKIKYVIDRAVVKASPFDLKINDIGIFTRKKTNILWVGIEENIVLSNIHKELTNLLREEKLPFYDKLFMPHITLGRRVKLRDNSVALDNLIEFEKITIPVKSISLMASVEENGLLNGVPIYKVKL